MFASMDNFCIDWLLLLRLKIMVLHLRYVLYINLLNPSACKSKNKHTYKKNPKSNQRVKCLLLQENPLFLLSLLYKMFLKFKIYCCYCNCVQHVWTHVIVCVCMRACACVCVVGQRTPLCSWFSPSTLMRVPGIKFRPIGLHGEHFFPLSHLTGPVRFFFRIDMHWVGWRGVWRDGSMSSNACRNWVLSPSHRLQSQARSHVCM